MRILKTTDKYTVIKHEHDTYSYLEILDSSEKGEIASNGMRIMTLNSGLITVTNLTKKGRGRVVVVGAKELYERLGVLMGINNWDKI